MLLSDAVVMSVKYIFTAIAQQILLLNINGFSCFQEKHIMSERNVLLKNVKHPFLVGLHFSFQTADKLYFVLDYINGGEVSSKKIKYRFLSCDSGRVGFYPFLLNKRVPGGKTMREKLLELMFPACQVLNYQRIVRPFPAIVLPSYIC